MRIPRAGSRRVEVVWTLALLAALPGASVVHAASPVLWNDDFSSARRYERQPAHAWSSAGRFRCTGQAVLRPPLANMAEGVLQCELTVGRRIGTGWTYAGVALQHSTGNTWQLLLVEGPDSKRYIEMMEELDGLRHAQSASRSATELAVEERLDRTSWDYGETYSLTLRLTAESIEGVVRASSGGPAWRRLYRFEDRRAVRSGRPTLMVSGVEGSVRRLKVEGPIEPVRDTLALRRGRTGSAVLIRSGDAKVDGALASALRDAGLGVVAVTRDELVTRSLPTAGVDLLVLADARSVSVEARDAVMRMLQTGGRVLAVGAPAGMKVLARTPDGWSDAEGWTQSVAALLRRNPLDIPPSAWRRTAYSLAQESRLEEDGGGIRVTVDLLNWDTWYADMPRGFGGDRLLVFEARGDAGTTHLAVECVEEDGSRWIATIPLSETWRWYILSPGDFGYWPDSPAKHRGGPGDRLQPEHVHRISFGLSGSHTPRVRPGQRSYCIRNLSTAPENAARRPDFGLPDVEALWPSYKLYPVSGVARLQPATEQGVLAQLRGITWQGEAYAPVWRERGRGIRRGRPWRWVPILEGVDRAGRSRGALLSVMLGDAMHPGSAWANLAVADPRQAVQPDLLKAVSALAGAMARGIWLLEGGAEFFSYRPGETVLLGARAQNNGRSMAQVRLQVRVTDAWGKPVFEAHRDVALKPGSEANATWRWKPTAFDRAGYKVTTRLLQNGRMTDCIEQRLDRLRTEPPRDDEFVRVQRSSFTLAGKPWYFQGINYWPTWMAGSTHLNQRSRECYDPEIIERDLRWLRSAGVNVLSAVAAIEPPDPDDPGGYRDQLDFLERCLRHGIRCYFTLPSARAYAGAGFERLKQYIERAGLHNHPAVMCWELAWEPIEGAWGNDLQKLAADWNRWIVEMYGSADAAVQDWGFDPRSSPDQPVPVPTHSQCTTSGAWDGYVAAFSRAFSDLIGRAYGRVARPLRAWDPNHLISFRGGACGIPSGGAFAHIHSVGVARHLDFLCPEGYNLQTGGWAVPTNPDDIRKGGLVTLYYRHVSGEKPVVWMEFGFTVNGFGEAWRQNRVHVRPRELENQRLEIERFYEMILESGSRGAAPWWLPGGFRLGENSDFGFLEPDGSERPVCTVFKAAQPRFAQVVHGEPDAFLTMEPESTRATAWRTFAPQYLDLVRQGKTVAVRTSGTGTDSATCPLVSVSGTPCNGHNPPRYLNAEFDMLEVRIGDGPWQEVTDGSVFEAPAGTAVRCRAVVGNIGEAAWLASAPMGAVRLAGRPEYGLAFQEPIPTDTPYLGMARVAEFVLIPSLQGRTAVSFQMEALGRTFFGERRTAVFVAR